MYTCKTPGCVRAIIPHDTCMRSDGSYIVGAPSPEQHHEMTLAGVSAPIARISLREQERVSKPRVSGASFERKRVYSNGQIAGYVGAREDIVLVKNLSVEERLNVDVETDEQLRARLQKAGHMTLDEPPLLKVHAEGSSRWSALQNGMLRLTLGAQHFDIPVIAGDTEQVIASNLSAALRAAPMSRSMPRAHSMPVACMRCGHCNSYSVGTLDPAEARCTHRFRLDMSLGVSGKLVCCTCPFSIERNELLRLEVDLAQRYDSNGNLLADVTQRTHDENNDLLAENARLRRRIEKLEREAKARSR